MSDQERIAYLEQAVKERDEFIEKLTTEWAKCNATCCHASGDQCPHSGEIETIRAKERTLGDTGKELDESLSWVWLITWMLS